MIPRWDDADLFVLLLRLIVMGWMPLVSNIMIIIALVFIEKGYPKK